MWSRTWDRDCGLEGDHFPPPLTFKLTRHGFRLIVPRPPHALRFVVADCQGVLSVCRIQLAVSVLSYWASCSRLCPLRLTPVVFGDRQPIALAGLPQFKQSINMMGGYQLHTTKSIVLLLFCAILFLLDIKRLAVI